MLSVSKADSTHLSQRGGHHGPTSRTAERTTGRKTAHVGHFRSPTSAHSKSPGQVARREYAAGRVPCARAAAGGAVGLRSHERFGAKPGARADAAGGDDRPGAEPTHRANSDLARG